MLKHQNKILLLFSNLKHNQLLLIKIRRKNYTEITESKSPTEVTRFSKPTGSALIPGITTPVQIPTKTIRSNSDIQNEPNTTEKFTSQGNFSGVTYYQFQVQNITTLLFLNLIEPKAIYQCLFHLLNLLT